MNRASSAGPILASSCCALRAGSGKPRQQRIGGIASWHSDGRSCHDVMVLRTRCAGLPADEERLATPGTLDGARMLVTFAGAPATGTDRRAG